jgi:3-dehydrosphinganine reductase
MNRFANKNVLITGGSSGIGFALAKLFLQNDARVWIIARDENKLKNAVKELTQVHSLCKYLVADVSNIDAVNKMFNNLQAETDKIDILINCAGVAYPGEFEQMELEKFHWLMDINFFGTVNVIKTCLPLLQSGAHIINVSSMAGLLGVYGYTAYGASKFAVRGFSDALRSEFKLKNINLSIVYPPDTDTPQLEFENQFKPAITKEIAGSANPMSVSSVAQDIFKGIQKKNYIIVPGFENKMLYFASNFLGKWVYPIMDLTISNVVKKLNRKKK